MSCLILRVTKHRSVLAMTTVIAVALVLGALPFISAVGAQADDKLQVVATFSIVYDVVKTVGGERVEVHSMVPLGQDPHEFTPLPVDVRKAADADAIFWNGLDMELGDGWFEGLLAVAGKSLDGGEVFALAEGVEPLYLTDDGRMEINPHAYLDVTVAMQYVRNARDGLIAVDPDYADVYERNAEAYLAELEQLHEQYVKMFGEIPPERRVLVTAERAFQYMAARYGFREGYVWAIDTDEQGTPRQILDLVRFVRSNQVPALFLESNVDPRPLETVSRETGVPIAGKIYSDELGRPGDDGATLLGMLEWNLHTIYNGLMGP